MKRNKNRGYQQLRVGHDAVEYYKQTWEVFRKLTYELKRVASQQIASSDSVHRNIAEGYCRRSIHEYIKFLYIALGFLGESVSGLYACREANQISLEDFEKLDVLAYKLENGLLKLIQSIEEKRELGQWTDHLIIKEDNIAYVIE
jgi:four helix bundle protein